MQRCFFTNLTTCQLSDLDFPGKHEQLNTLVAQVQAKGRRAIAIVADVCKEADVDKLITDTVAAFGALDVVSVLV